MGGTHTRRWARGETGWRVGPGAHRRPSKPTRPATTPRAVRGVPRTRACARPFPATCHQKTQSLPQAPHTAAGRQSPVPRDPSSYSERGGAGRGRRESKRCAQKAEVRAGSRGDHPGEAPSEIVKPFPKIAREGKFLTEGGTNPTPTSSQGLRARDGKRATGAGQNGKDRAPAGGGGLRYRQRSLPPVSS